MEHISKFAPQPSLPNNVTPTPLPPYPSDVPFTSSFQLKNKYGDAFIRGNNGACVGGDGGLLALFWASVSGVLRTPFHPGPTSTTNSANPRPLTLSPAPPRAVLYISAASE